MSDDVPFHAGAFESMPDGPVLLGSRCRACAQVYHPRTSTCLNCGGADLEDIHLSRRGRLECCTTVYMPTATMEAPYTVGYVQLPEGLRVFAPIQGATAALKVGASVTLARCTVGRGEKRLAAYCFVPA